ncbi:uncharacterized protein LOC126688059 isoform X2 [Mercurialis annua]|uniref:uncharacterized protein LOC126688059 isoform X2 n=1 Tax=Mercurialis annua TaxID=3986 RepID=UPI00216033C6|nr:uncharacterized protein LOC126688059 isoform X2 [Mercurialis annua]
MAEKQTETVNSTFHGGDDDHNYLYSQFFAAFNGVKRWASTTIFLFFCMLFLGAFFFRIDVSIIRDTFLVDTRIPIEFPLECPEKGTPITCKANYPEVSSPSPSSSLVAACPDYFRWIHEDLRPWKDTGISRETVEDAKRFATFRLVIINGTAYLERYHRSFQTRDLFTLWGILQLLRLYPGKVPDLELMFRCGDMPVIQKNDYQGTNATLPPPVLFQYSGNDETFAVTFPDWSFWGWAEVNIRPWKNMIEAIKRGAKKKKWKNREPYAYWKGSPSVSPNREDLLRCNVSDKQDWNARLYVQDWVKEVEQGYKHSKLEDQCDHGYKIYIEGRAWSVSDKYIIACDSMTLMVKPVYYDFFIRSLMPLQHYWPISTQNKCPDIKFAVQWGNNHPDKAQAIGKGGSKFIEEDMKMENIYGYMLHLLNEYAKLLKFKPEIPKGGGEVLCVESMACNEGGLVRNFLEESMVLSPSTTPPCSMSPHYDHSTLHRLFEEKENITRKIEMWRNDWQHFNKG